MWPDLNIYANCDTEVIISAYCKNKQSKIKPNNCTIPIYSILGIYIINMDNKNSLRLKMFSTYCLLLIENYFVNCSLDRCRAVGWANFQLRKLSKINRNGIWHQRAWMEHGIMFGAMCEWARSWLEISLDIYICLIGNALRSAYANGQTSDLMIAYLLEKHLECLPWNVCNGVVSFVMPTCITTAKSYN